MLKLHTLGLLLHLSLRGLLDLLHSGGLRLGLGDRQFLLGVKDGDDIRGQDSDTVLASGVMRQLDLDLDTQHTLLELDVADSEVDVVVHGISGLDHVSIAELHRLGTGSAELSGDHNLNTLWTEQKTATEEKNTHHE